MGRAPGTNVSAPKRCTKTAYNEIFDIFGIFDIFVEECGLFVSPSVTIFRSPQPGAGRLRPG
jgi:hypothetical protein